MTPASPTEKMSTLWMESSRTSDWATTVTLCGASSSTPAIVST
jgi:hypothetical protein